MPKGQKMTHEAYVARFKELHPNLEIISQYGARGKQIIVRCPTHGEFVRGAAYMINPKGCGCSMCRKLARPGVKASGYRQVTKGPGAVKRRTKSAVYRYDSDRGAYIEIPGLTWTPAAERK